MAIRPPFIAGLRLRFRAGDATHRLRFEVCDARDGAAVIAAARVGLVELHDQAARDVDEQALSSDAAALSLPLCSLVMAGLCGWSSSGLWTLTLALNKKEAA